LCTTQSLWFRAHYQELALTLIPAEEKTIRGRVSRKEIAEERMWRKRPDGIAIKMSTDEPNRWQKINTHPSDQLLAIPCATKEDGWLSR
jgi:hypothetical protein